MISGVKLGKMLQKPGQTSESKKGGRISRTQGFVLESCCGAGLDPQGCWSLVLGCDRDPGPGGQRF